MAKLKEMLPKKEVTVQEIHDEFDNASNAFVEQIRKMLEKTSETDLENVATLKRLGFRNAGNVKRYEKLIESKEDAEKAKQYIDEYALRYTEKFITEKMVELICKKYGLVLGETRNFVGEIPRKNIEELVTFAAKFRAKDKRDNYRGNNFMASSAYIVPSYSDTMVRRAFQGIPSYMPPVPESDWDIEMSEREKINIAAIVFLSVISILFVCCFLST